MIKLKFELDKTKRRARVRESRRRESTTHHHSCNNNDNNCCCYSSSSDDNAGIDSHAHTRNQSFMIRHHSDETLDRSSSLSTRIDQRTNRYYRRRSQEFILKPLSSYIVSDATGASSSCNVADNKSTTATTSAANDDTSSDPEIKVTAKPPLTSIQLQWVKSNIYSPRRSLRRSSEELISCHSIDTSDIQSTVSLDNLTLHTHNNNNNNVSRPDNRTKAPISSNNLTSYDEVNLVNRSTNASVDSVDFRCLDDFLPKISSSDPVIYRKYGDLAGEDQVDGSIRVSRYESMLTVSNTHNTSESHHSLINYLSTTADSGVSSQSVASSPILSQAPSPPPRNRVGKITSKLYGSIIKPRSSSAASSVTSPPLINQGHNHPSGSSSRCDLYRKHLSGSNSRDNDHLSKSYHDLSIEYINNINSNNNIDEAYSQQKETFLIKPKNENNDDKTTTMKALEPKKSVRDIINNIESNLKSSSTENRLNSPVEKFNNNNTENSLKSVLKGDSTKENLNNFNSKLHSDEMSYSHQLRKSSILKREQFRKHREPFITQVHLPNRYTSGNQSDESFLNKRKPKPSLIINLNSWSRPKPNKFLTGANFRKFTSKDSKIRKLDEAISELEEIYESLNLDDEDLLDRAERRDMPAKFQLMRFESSSNDTKNNLKYHNGCITHSSSSSYPAPPLPIIRSPIYPRETGWKHPHCESFCQTRHRRQSLGCVEMLLASSDPPYRDKAPPRRRSAVPDFVSDDLAARKMVKSKLNDQNNGNAAEEKKIPSYLLLSPIYSPTSRDIADETIDSLTTSLEPEPDIEKDDLSYRKFIQSDAATVPPPHPPFGIPIGVTGLSTLNNYVQATLSEKDANFSYYRVKPYYPHLVKDDMAFRNFRKDLGNNKPQYELRKSWSETGVKLLPLTTKHLISQRNETRGTRPTSLNLSYNNNNDKHGPYYHYLDQHQYPTRVSLLATEFENQGSLV